MCIHSNLQDALDTNEFRILSRSVRFKCQFLNFRSFFKLLVIFRLKGLLVFYLNFDWQPFGILFQKSNAWKIEFEQARDYQICTSI